MSGSGAAPKSTGLPVVAAIEFYGLGGDLGGVNFSGDIREEVGGRYIQEKLR